MNKIINSETGESVKMSDPLDTPIVVLSAGEEFKAKSDPLIIEDAMTNTQIEIKESESVVIEDHIKGRVLEV